MFKILKIIGKIIKIIKINSDPYLDLKYKDFIFRNSVITRFNKESLELSYQYFKKYFSESFLCRKKHTLREYSFKLAIKDYQTISEHIKQDETNLKREREKESGFLMEFGVFEGKSLKQFMSLTSRTIYGFDSFLGLTEAWTGNEEYKPGTFELKKEQIPTFEKNIKLIIGDVYKTLPEFIQEKEKLLIENGIDFIHMDLDTYEVSEFVLKNLKKYLNKNSVILFDELYNHPGWDKGEFLALKKCFDENQFKYIGFSDATSAAIKVL